MRIHPFFDNRICVERLLKEASQHNQKLIVAFDFDNTIFDYHNTGDDYSAMITLLKKCSDRGFIMVLFTANSDPKRFEFQKAFCEHYGIRVDYINESPVMPGSRKPYYNILLDDRAGLYESYCVLNEVINYLDAKEYNESINT